MATGLSEKRSSSDMAKHEETVVATGQDTGTIVDESEMPLRTAIRRFPKVAGYSFFVTLAILLWGYDLVIVGTVSSIPAFQMVFGEPYEDRYIIPSTWLAVWQVSTNIGLMAGAVFCGGLQDRIGRRWSLFAFSMLISAAVAICYVSDLPESLNGKRGLFFVAKTVQGFGIGGMVSISGRPQTPLWQVDPLSQLRADQMQQMCTTQTWLVSDSSPSPTISLTTVV